jgi:hypothetical protein
MVDVDRAQCVSTEDCARRGLAGDCRRGVCVSSGCDGGRCASALAASCSGDRDCITVDALCFKNQCVQSDEVAGFVCAPVAPAGKASVRFSLQLEEFVSQSPPKLAMVIACLAGDLLCAEPITARTDASGSGEISLDLPYGFVGFLEVHSANTLTALYYITQPYTTERSQPLWLMTAQTRDILALAAGHPADPSRGLVIMQAYDCSGRPVGGIRFEAGDSSGVRFSLLNAVPIFDSPVTIRDDETDTAIAGFVDAAPGFTVFSAHIGVGGPLLGQFNANVRPNSVTYLQWFP